MNEKELMIVEGESYLGQPINRDLVVEFGDTLMGVHPNAKEVGLQGMRTVAQLALITGANPLPGTNGIHAWRDKKGNICISFGIGYWRTQAELEGGILWTDKPRPMTDSERQYYGITELQLASICGGALKKAAFSLMQESRNLGYEMSLKDAKDEVGRVGIGLANPNEYAKSGRPNQWSADKRAEADLTSKLVPPMSKALQNARDGVTVSGGLDWSAGEYAHLQTERNQVTDGYGAEEANADLFDDDPPVEVDILTGEIIEDEPEPEEEQPETANANRGGPRVTKAMLRELHALGTFIYMGGWDAERARRSKEFGVESSKDWPLKGYHDAVNELKDLKEKQIEAEENKSAE